ncbi:acyl-CoA reductase [Stackebrandtia soli]|uniref:acyl-CoA reductase n=1 Tax=Stackebrandtia soli TaxID=1892856 RepID=UPI0039EA88A0
MTLTALFPSPGDTTADETLAALTDTTLSFGDERVRAYLADVATALLRPTVARRHPELAALGFFLRRGEIEALLRRTTTPPGTTRLPRGLVFHIPPANVDTLFVYSWALSALAGNSNVVRVSPRADAAATTLLRILTDSLANADPVIAATQRMVGYDRDATATAAFSAACALRVIWGGDRAIAAIREAPLPPRSRDVTFADRSSYAAFSVDGWHAADGPTRDATALGLRNDAYWFDQAACASPRAIAWIGGVADDADACHRDLMARVAAQAPTPRPELAVRLRAETYRLAADGDADALRYADGDRLASARLTSTAPPPRRWLGPGVFPYAHLASGAALASLLTRHDQTVTHFGFGDEFPAFAEALAIAGVDRIVPVGTALDFGAIWDGYDLITEFSRLSVITP